MKQITKIYLTEFLKTQRYYLPVIILFFQFHHLTYTEIFILYAARSMVIFLLEIPSGVIADQYGKKTALLISRAALIPAYALFALASDFGLFFAAMVMEAVNKAFKSGTHKAYIYDFLLQDETSVAPSEVYGKNKFWARMGEASAALAGGFIASGLGYSAVFWFALGPAALNLLNAFTYYEISEEKKEKLSWNIHGHIKHIQGALTEIKNNRNVQRLIINSAVFVGSLGAAVKFLQPYMKQADIPLEWFGIVYTAVMMLTAVSSRYVYLLEKRIKRSLIANAAGWAAVAPILLLGLRKAYLSGILFFILLYIFKHARRPAMITELNEYISAGKRATILSADSIIRSLFQLVFLPAVGFVSDSFSIYTALLMISAVLILNQFFFSIPSAEE